MSETSTTETRVAIPGYPYFEVQRWVGRLPTPPQFRRTSIALQFESGRIGGRKPADRQRFEDTEEGRRSLRDWVRRHQGEALDLVYVVHPNRNRVRLQTPVLFAPGFVREGVPPRYRR